MTTLVSVFKEIKSEDKTKYDNFYSSSKAEIIISESDNDDVFQSIYTTIITNIESYLGKGLGWVDLLIEEEKQYVLINDFNRSMSNHSLHCGRKHFVVAVYTLSLQRKC